MTTSSYNAAADIEGQFAQVSRLLVGACRTITKFGGLEAMGPELRDWWSKHPEAADERARRVLLSIPDEDVKTLNEYIARHGKLPTGLVPDAPQE